MAAALAALALLPPTRAEAQGAPVSVADLQSALPGVRLIRVDAAELSRFAAAHAGEGRLLTRPALASLAATAAPTEESDRPSDEADIRCRNPDTASRRACLDSLRAARQGLSGRGNLQDTLDRGGRDKSRAAEADASAYDDRPQGYLAQFFFDLRHGDWNWDAKDWAAVIYVVVGVVVVGAFVLYGVQALYDLIVNKDRSPVFREFGLRYSYSGKAWRDGAGPALYRDANLLGLRFAIGLDRGDVGLGLSAEGGYIDLALRGVDDPARSFEFSGGYLVAGPMIRFGRNDPLSFNLEFLNGTSDHPSIGWISKARMALEGRVGPGLLLGAHLGAVFYDLHFFDGLGLRSGDFNRDLSLVSGVDIGWMF